MFLFLFLFFFYFSFFFVFIFSFFLAFLLKIHGSFSVIHTLFLKAKFQKYNEYIKHLNAFVDKLGIMQMYIYRVQAHTLGLSSN